MRPLFSRYGGKYRGAKWYGPPRRGRVTEPFAGSACYSLYWDCPEVRLFDKDEDVCAVFDWVFNCSEDDIRRAPIKICSNEEWRDLPDGLRQLVFFNTCYCRATVSQSLPGWYLHYCRTGEPTGPLLNSRDFNTDRIGDPKYTNSLRVWGERLRNRILEQKPKLKGWSIDCLDYRDIPIEDCHWHIDPPYQSPPGRVYKHNHIDYAHLAEWIRNLPGAVDVCEYEGADWLPFKPLYVGTTMNTTKKCTEVVWRNEPVDLLGLM